MSDIEAALAATEPLSRLHDRCDSCGAQAFVQVGKLSGEGILDLLFYAHHFAKHELVLVSGGWQLIRDERSSINEKPSVSANVE